MPLGPCSHLVQNIYILSSQQHYSMVKVIRKTKLPYKTLDVCNPSADTRHGRVPKSEDSRRVNYFSIGAALLLRLASFLLRALEPFNIGHIIRILLHYLFLIVYLIIF
jgi:hypothetical protein